MILEYHRPKTIDEALTLLSRQDPKTIPLGGGTVLSQPMDEAVALVDLQDLDLAYIREQGNSLVFGAMTSLEAVSESEKLPQALRGIARREAGYNLRQSASIAGTLVSGDGRSPVLSGFLAINAGLRLMPGGEVIPYGELLPARGETLAGKIITEVSIPQNAELYYEQVARSPADRPLVAAAVASWPSGRIRVVLGGYGEHPILVFDGPQAGGAEEAAGDAYSRKSDAWATGEYRGEVAQILVHRAIQSLQNNPPTRETGSP